MSNEYKDWLRDQASDIMLDNGTLRISSIVNLFMAATLPLVKIMIGAAAYFLFGMMTWMVGVIEK